MAELDAPPDPPPLDVELLVVLVLEDDVEVVLEEASPLELEACEDAPPVPPANW